MSGYRAVTVTTCPDRDANPRFELHGETPMFATLWFDHDFYLSTTDPQWLRDIGNVALAAAIALENAQAAKREMTS